MQLRGLLLTSLAVALLASVARAQSGPVEAPCSLSPCQVPCLPGLELCDGECRSPDSVECRCPGCRAPAMGSARCDRGRCSFACEAPAARCGDGCCLLSAGGSVTCLVDARGQVFCWGANGSGQLGDATKRDALRPVRLERLFGPLALANSLYSGCAVRPDGAVECWGWHSQAGAPVAIGGTGTDLRALAAGRFQFCGLGRAGSVRCWGHSKNLFPTQDSSTHEALPIPGLEADVRDVAGGGDHTCAITRDGRVVCWGDNGHGQLGTGDTEPRPIPAEVVGLDGPAERVACGLNHTCAVLRSGRVQCWGDGRGGQLGQGRGRSSKALTVPGVEGAVGIALGDSFSCARLRRGTVACWGDNGYGALGQGDTEPRRAPVKVKGLEAGTGVVALAAGSHHACALLADGSPRCWGYNDNGQVGDGSTQRRYLPVPVVLP